ncbi:hypothetical protein [Micromonospora marina]|uniref:hypothetical protein n=1 Tax=Micromonospora marina TaxID=307120 RepID=UPI003452E5A8
MTTSHYVRGEVPPDSPLRALAGRTVTLPAADLPQLATRVRELRRADIDPVVLPVRYVPWTPVLLAGAGLVLVDVATVLAAILIGHTLIAWTAAGVGVVLGLLLLLACLHMEMDR